VRRVAGGVIVSNHPPAYAHYFARKSATPLSHIVKADVCRGEGGYPPLGEGFLLSDRIT